MYFTKTNDLNELRDQYRKLAKEYHPDLNPDIDENIMKQINNEYEQLLNSINTENNTHIKYEYEQTWQSKFIETLKIFASMPDIIVEMIGNWIWISGNTKPIKEQLKSLNFKFSGKKVAWYWKSYRYFKKSDEDFELDDLRNIYGSEKLQGNQPMTENLITA